MTTPGHRFNPPPNWPSMPPGWTPPAGWKSPDDWPAAPAGWQFWVPTVRPSWVSQHKGLTAGLAAGGGVLAVVLVVAAAMAVPPAPATRAGGSAPASPSASAATKPSPATKAPVPPATPQQKLTQSIGKKLGSSNRKVKRLKSVEYSPGQTVVAWSINDNLTESYVKRGARSDALDIVEAVKASGLPVKELVVQGSFPLVDQFGKTTEGNVTTFTFSAATLAKMNPKDMDPMNVDTVADFAAVVKAFRY